MSKSTIIGIVVGVIVVIIVVIIVVVAVIKKKIKNNNNSSEEGMENKQEKINWYFNGQSSVVGWYNSINSSKFKTLLSDGILFSIPFILSIPFLISSEIDSSFFDNNNCNLSAKLPTNSFILSWG